LPGFVLGLKNDSNIIINVGKVLRSTEIQSKVKKMRKNLPIKERVEESLQNLALCN
jgi:hypothetical protein